MVRIMTKVASAKGKLYSNNRSYLEKLAFELRAKFGDGVILSRTHDADRGDFLLAITFLGVLEDEEL